LEIDDSLKFQFIYKENHNKNLKNMKFKKFKKLKKIIKLKK